MKLKANVKNVKTHLKSIMGNSYSPVTEIQVLNFIKTIKREDFVEGREHKSFSTTRYMEELNKLIKSYGVESLYPDWPEWFYLNFGDTYDTTFLYNYKTDTLYIGDWGSLVEKF